MKGKLISFNPKMKDGSQETFTYADKTFYVFIITAEIDRNIQVGDANSLSATPKWELNKECEITVEKNDKATSGNKFKLNFSEGKPSGSSRTYGKSAAERMEIISQSSFATAIHYINVLDVDERKAIFEKYGPDDAFINFAKRISQEIIKNAKELEAEN